MSRRGAWAPELRADVSALLGRMIAGGGPAAVEPALSPGRLALLVHDDTLVAAGVDRADAAAALDRLEADDAEVGLTRADHVAWVAGLHLVQVQLTGPVPALRGVLAHLGLRRGHGWVPLGPSLEAGLAAAGLLYGDATQPLPWGIEVDELPGEVKQLQGGAA